MQNGKKNGKKKQCANGTISVFCKSPVAAAWIGNDGADRNSADSIRNGKDWLLRRELEYAMHQLDTGSEESWVYEQLGRRLELPEYYQLLQHISQHIRMGTKDLRNLMEQEMQQVLEKRRELAKKKERRHQQSCYFP